MYIKRLLIIGFILIGPEFGAKTVYCSILMPVIIGYRRKDHEQVPQNGSGTGYVCFRYRCGAVLCTVL